MARPVVLPESFVAWLWPYLEAFSGRTRATVAALAVGAVLAVGPRTVTNVLRTLGLAESPASRRSTGCSTAMPGRGWCWRAPSVHALVAAFVPDGPIIIGVDHTLERRRGPCIAPASHYYDAVRSSKEQTVTTRACAG